MERNQGTCDVDTVYIMLLFVSLADLVWTVILRVWKRARTFFVDWQGNGRLGTCG
jgi:hypothetical protein